ncbi:hypothetical protein ACW6B4_001033 [Yersinia ruckeri]|uniref:hypothetical protein n=2 Tax=Yersinia ruckeri TaxID=29486 RepID=UPI0018F85938|nr:hypothetical protein [Yersinia ruckeri]WMS06686.1 hypothetical protein RDY86_06075 [Yersinia ruckeri]
MFSLEIGFVFNIAEAQCTRVKADAQVGRASQFFSLGFTPGTPLQLTRQHHRLWMTSVTDEATWERIVRGQSAAPKFGGGLGIAPTVAGRTSCRN